MFDHVDIACSDMSTASPNNSTGVIHDDLPRPRSGNYGPFFPITLSDTQTGKTYRSFCDQDGKDALTKFQARRSDKLWTTDPEICTALAQSCIKAKTLRSVFRKCGTPQAGTGAKGAYMYGQGEMERLTELCRSAMFRAVGMTLSPETLAWGSAGLSVAEQINSRLSYAGIEEYCHSACRNDHQAYTDSPGASTYVTPIRLSAVHGALRGYVAVTVLQYHTDKKQLDRHLNTHPLEVIPTHDGSDNDNGHGSPICPFRDNAVGCEGCPSPDVMSAWDSDESESETGVAQVVSAEEAGSDEPGEADSDYEESDVEPCGSGPATTSHKDLRRGPRRLTRGV